VNISRLLSSDVDCRYVGHVMGTGSAAGSGQIWLDNVQCKGCEWSLDHCSHSSWGSHNCDHRDDVSIACYDDTSPAPTMSTTTTTTSRPTSLLITNPSNLNGDLKELRLLPTIRSFIPGMFRVQYLRVQVRVRVPPLRVRVRVRVPPPRVRIRVRVQYPQLTA